MNNAKGPERVLIVGAYPPPTGGISVHVARLADLLTQIGSAVTVLDLYGHADAPTTAQEGPGVIRLRSGFRGALAATRLLFSNRFDVLHVHVSGFGRGIGLLRIALWFVSSKRRMITIHSGSFVPRMREGGSRLRSAIIALLEGFDTVICVGAEQRRWLVDAGLDERGIAVIPAFLSPERAGDADVERQMQALRMGNDFLVATSGYGVAYYGYDTILDALADLRSNGLRIALAVAFYSTYDEVYFEKLVARMDGMEDVHMFRDLTPAAFGDVLYHADGYIRATDRDGDAVAIREAIHWGCQVFATDVVVRPEGCTLFPYGDANALATVLAAARHKTATNDTGHRSDALLELYSGL